MRTRSNNAGVRALELGAAAPRGDFRFSVHSAFGSAVNLEPAGGGGLVTLVGAEDDCPPRGMRLSCRGGFDTWGVEAGAPGAREGETLLLEAAEGSEAIRIDLSRARRLAALPLPRIDPSRPGLGEAWSGCAAALEGIQERKGTELRLAELRGGAPPGSLSGTAMGARLAASALALAEALRGDVDGACEAAARLVGLGPGLTPSGDDFLCGLLAALRCCGGAGREGAGFTTEFSRRLPALSVSTNAISSTSLGCAAAGAFASPVLRLAGALASGEGRPREAVEALCAAGHSSGADTATGMLFWVGILLEKERRRYAP